MQIYDEENINLDDADDEMSGYTVVEDNSIFNNLILQDEEQTIASPIPENEQTVILSDPDVIRLGDGAPLTLEFTDGDSCSVFSYTKKVGGLKSAYVKKLKTERGGQKASAFFKQTAPPMIRIVFGEGTTIPKAD